MENEEEEEKCEWTCMCVICWSKRQKYLSEQLLTAQREYNRGVIVMKEGSDVVEEFIS